jgi:hypothetical protein
MYRDDLSCLSKKINENLERKYENLRGLKGLKAKEIKKHMKKQLNP